MAATTASRPPASAPAAHLAPTFATPPTSPSPQPGASGPQPSTSSSAANQWDGLDTTSLRDLSRRGLLDALDSVREAKTLMLDPALAGPLGLVADVGSLKQHGVDKMFWLEVGRPGEGITAPTRSIVYLCRTEVRWMRIIAGHIKANRSTQQTQHTYTVVFAPRRTELCMRALEEEGVLHEVSVVDYGLEFVPLEKDVLSMEDDRAWPAIFGDGDHTSIYHSAQALMTMQHVYGLFSRIVGKGNLAKRLADLLMRQRREHLSADPSNPALTTPSTNVDSLIILDRSVDLASPLCTQLTYEGLVDEAVGIRNAHIEVDPALLSNTTNARNTPSGSGTPLQMTSAPRKKKHRLDAASDNLFAEIRDQNFAVVGEMLHKVARRINEDYEGRHQAKTVQQIREFVGRLGGLQSEHQSLRLHTSLTEQIMGMTGTEEFNRALEIQQNLVAGVDLAAQQAAIEDLINAEAPMLLVLRLLCLSSIVGGGIKPKNLEFVKREILQTYGYEHLPLLLALTRVGLLTKATSSSSRSSTGFAAVRRPLKLINDDVDERAPTDISYVYSGYAPLSVRLVQAIAQKEALVDASAGAPRTARNVLPRAHPIVGWRGFEDVVRSLPGATFDEEQSVPNSSTARRPAPHDPEATTTTIVFFLGGVTYTEIAALRFMSRQTRNRRFLVATTNMIGGNTLVSSFGNVGNEAKPMVLAPTL